MRRTAIIFLLGVSFTSCYYDKEDLLYPAGNCDTTGVTYSGTVATALQGNSCMSCHSGGAPSGNISLEGYNNVRTVALNGKLLGTISHTGGFAPMPQGGPKMNECTINKIRAWINAGAPNN